MDIRDELRQATFDTEIPDSAFVAALNLVRVYAQNLIATQQLEEAKRQLVEAQARHESDQEEIKKLNRLVGKGRLSFYVRCRA